MKRLFAAAAFAPLCLVAQQAHAQTQINSATTTPLVTSSAFNVEITASGSVVVTTGGAAVTVNSDHTLTANGPVSVRNSPSGGTAVLVVTPTAGLTSNIALNANVIADDTTANTDTDRDGDLDGQFVPTGIVRYGLRVTGSGPFNGNITTGLNGLMAVEGNDGSAGVLIETPLNGNLTLKGQVGVLGSDSFGVRLKGPVTGNVSIGGLVNAQGQNAVGIQVEDKVDGTFRIDGTVNATGYRYSDLNALPTEASKLDADDLLIGGAGVRIMADLTKGLVFDAPPPERLANNNDEDGDLLPDSEETKSSVRSYGSAPAVLIGHTSNAVALGAVTVGDFPTLGIHVNGDVLGEGLFDGVNGTAMRIGGLGGTVDVADGMLIRGRLAGGAAKANATGLIIGAGAKVPNIILDGGELSAGVNQTGTSVRTAQALVIEQGATVQNLFINGLFGARVTGEFGDAVALVDRSGTVRKITNVGQVSAAVASSNPDTKAVGTRTAFDLRANTTGVEIEQRLEGNTIVVTNGDILFGQAANDVLKINYGTTSGAVDFGGGNDILTIGQTGKSTMELRKSVGGLDVDVAGNLTLTNTYRAAASKLNASSTSLITFTADPKNLDATRRVTFLDVAGVATLDAGSRVDLNFVSKISGLTTFEVLRAQTLNNNGVNANLASNLPYVFAGSARVTGNSIFVDVRKRTPAEMGLLDGRGAAYEAFYAAFDADPDVANAVFTKKTASEFTTLFDQFLPDYSGGPFNGLANAARAVYQAQGEEVRDMVPGEPRSWLQEVGVGTKFESVNDIDYQTGGFGVAGGVEHQFAGNQFYGLSGAFMTSEIRNANRALGSLLTGSAVMGSVYWRAQEGPMVLDASLSGAYTWFESDRRVVDQLASGAQTLIRQASADWNGALAGGRVGVTYNWNAGPFYVKHDAVLDAVYMRENGYAENGGGQGVNLRVGERDTYEVAAEAGILLGARFGRSFRWGPELRVAYRGQLDGGEGETIGNFISAPNQGFILPGLIKDRQRIVVRAALRGSGAYTNFAFEASGDIGEIYQAYMARFVVRFLF